VTATADVTVIQAVLERGTRCSASASATSCSAGRRLGTYKLSTATAA